MKDIQVIYDERRIKNSIDLENRKNEVFRKVPEIARLIELIKIKNIERINLSLENKDVSKINNDIKEMIERKKQLFIENNIPMDYLDLKYHCNICRDTGIDGTKICECRKKLKIQRLQEESHINQIITYENFENFNLDLFRKSIQNGEEISPYENMIEQKNELEEYAKNFGKDSANLYIYGPVGTGKTFMLNCIAKVVLDLGYSVLYLSESNLVDTILENKYAYSHLKSDLRPKIDAIKECDLLIIDDLGSNSINENTKAAIFEVINDRIVRRLPMLISSNFDPEEIRIKYDTRIFSRIIGNFYLKKFYGNDLRML